MSLFLYLQTCHANPKSGFQKLDTHENPCWTTCTLEHEVHTPELQTEATCPNGEQRKKLPIGEVPMHTGYNICVQQSGDLSPVAIVTLSQSLSEQRNYLVSVSDRLLDLASAYGSNGCQHC